MIRFPRDVSKYFSDISWHENLISGSLTIEQNNNKADDTECLIVVRIKSMNTQLQNQHTDVAKSCSSKGGLILSSVYQH